MEAKLKQNTKFLPKETEDFQIVYSNAITISISNVDFAFDIGYFSSKNAIVQGTEVTIPIDIKSRVIMSPQHAKIFSDLLMTNIHQYESDFGEIQIEPKKK